MAEKDIAQELEEYQALQRAIRGGSASAQGRRWERPSPPPPQTNGHHSPVGSASGAHLPLNIFAALQSRAALSHRLGNIFDGRRNMHELLGYKLILQYRDFKARYLRQHIAHRLVRVYPEATW